MENKILGRYVLLLVSFALIFGCQPADAESSGRARYELKPEKVWQLGRKRFDASGLLMLPTGELLTVNNYKTPESPLFQIEFKEASTNAKLIRLPDYFNLEQIEALKKSGMKPFVCDSSKNRHLPEAGFRSFNWEGIARDKWGRIYVCEENNRLVLRFDPATNMAEELKIDWSSVCKKYFINSDRNSGFEGVAVSDEWLFLANERDKARLIMVGLKNNKVHRDFIVVPTGTNEDEVDVSDLYWFDDSLWVLCRFSQKILQVKIDASTQQVVAEFDYASMEKAPKRDNKGYKYLYKGKFPTMEGLALDAKYIWLVTDNNGRSFAGTQDDTEDHPPSLFRCLRPDLK